MRAYATKFFVVVLLGMFAMTPAFGRGGPGGGKGPGPGGQGQGNGICERKRDGTGPNCPQNGCPNPDCPKADCPNPDCPQAGQNPDCPKQPAQKGNEPAKK